jgi:hypothetical protein
VEGTTPTTKPGTPATTVTTAAPLPPVAGPVGDPGQPTAPASGTYMYNYTATSGKSGDTSSGTVTEKVTTTSSAGGVTRQSVVDNGPDQRATRNRVLEWRPSGLFEMQEVLNFGNQTVTCSWNPPVLEAPNGLAIGKTWVLNGTCQFSAYGQPFTLHLNGTARVNGKQRVMVGADAVNVWAMSVNYTASAANPALGSFAIHFDGVDKFAARLGLVVEEDATTTVTSASTGQQSAHIHQAAKSIHPS